MNEDDFGISQESVGEALEYAKHCVPLVRNNLQSEEQSTKAGDTRKANCEIGFGQLRLITESSMLMSIRLFVEAAIKRDLDGSFKNMFAYMIGGLEVGDLIPADYETFYGADGFSQAYRNARVSHSTKIQKKIAKIIKPWEDDATDKLWDSVLLLVNSKDYAVIKVSDIHLDSDNGVDTADVEDLEPAIN